MLGLCGFEEFSDELDFAQNTRLFVMDVTAFDGSHCLASAEGRFGREQRWKTLTVAEQRFMAA